MSPRADFSQRYGKWAVISGGAEGIGAGYGARLAAMKMPLILLDINSERLEATAAALRLDHAVEVRTVAVDLSDAVALNAAIDAIADLEIGLLVANAGIGAVGRWLEVPLEVKMKQIAINCTSTLILAHRLTPAMVQRRRGGVIIIRRSVGRRLAGRRSVASRLFRSAVRHLPHRIFRNIVRNIVFDHRALADGVFDRFRRRIGGHLGIVVLAGVCGFFCGL